MLPMVTCVSEEQNCMAWFFTYVHSPRWEPMSIELLTYFTMCCVYEATV